MSGTSAAGMDRGASGAGEIGRDLAGLRGWRGVAGAAGPRQRLKAPGKRDESAYAAADADCAG